MDEKAAARAPYQRLNDLVPGTSISKTFAGIPFHYQEDLQHYLMGFRRAGMPEEQKSALSGEEA